MTDDPGVEFPHEALPLPVAEAFTRDGRPVRDPISIAEVFSEAFAQRWVAYTELHLPQSGDRVVLSTVFLGLDAGMGMAARPLLFESQVFGSHLDRHVERYPDEPQARVGHVELLARLVLDLNGGALPSAPRGHRAPEPEAELVVPDPEPQRPEPEDDGRPTTEPMDPPSIPAGTPVVFTGENNWGTADDVDDPAPAGHPVDPAAPTTGPVRSIRVDTGPMPAPPLPDFPAMDSHDDTEDD